MKLNNIVLISAVLVLIIFSMLIFTNRSSEKGDLAQNSNNPSLDKNYQGEDYEEIYLAGGCFWGLEEYMERVPGVIDAVSGYANGETENPSYEDVLYKGTGHAETVHVKYDPEAISFEEILLYYFKVIDPTSLNKQGNDRGSQYRTGIYYLEEDQLDIIHRVVEEEQKSYKEAIVVEIEPIDGFYKAEEYHQDYLKKNPGGYCHIDLGLAQEGIGRDDLSIGDGLVKEDLYRKPSEEEIRQKLKEEEYRITQKGDTERAYSHDYNQLDEKGIYVDIVTGEPLFSSEDKYDAGCGWPSFTKPIDNEAIKNKEDTSLGMKRVEIKSRVGDSHLGHVFEDGPREEGGLRYCLNGGALRFVAYEDMEEEGYGYLLDIFED